MRVDQRPQQMVGEKSGLVAISLDDRQITLLGTAHVSRSSAAQVTERIDSNDYDAVAVELCASRHRSMMEPDAVAKMDLFQVFREGKAAMVTASLALGAYQQRIAEQLGIEPGADMRAALDSAERHGHPVLLIDRDIGITLKRVYRNVPWWRRLHLVTGLLSSVLSKEEVSEEEVERLKQGDILQTTIAQFADQAQEIYVPLIAERDRYMAARLRQELARLPHQRVLAVVGAGHLEGIEKHLQSDARSPEDTVHELEQIPPSGRALKLLPWVIVVVVAIGFGLGFARSPALGWQLVADWVLINGGLSALGALLAGAHPLTTVTAFLAAPLTSLNPTVGAGMVTGAVETYLRKPEVGDFSRLRTEAASFRGWWRNRVTRILLVFIFSTAGSAIGTYVAGFRIFERLTS